MRSVHRSSRADDLRTSPTSCCRLSPRRHWLSFLRSKYVPWYEKVDSAFFLLTWTNSLVITPTLVFLPWVVWGLHLIPLWLSILITALPLSLYTLPIGLGTSARLSLTGWMWYYVMLVPGYFVMFRACLLGLFTEPGFVRTLKETTSTTKEERRAQRGGTAVAAGPALRSGLRAARPLHRLVCGDCGAPLSHREVLFYAVGALDVKDMVCRKCLGATERARHWGVLLGA